jgi:DNA-binding winged helix-turn-helix (wHTH) protein/tetratricopeptide (TPR) repeat protein
MAAEIFRFEDFELDRAAYELRRAGRNVRLERIPLDLLFLLVERHGYLVTRQEIVDRVWGKEVFLDTEHGINTAARKIRQALSDNPEAPRFVLTVPAKGYRFVASVEKVEATPVAVPPNGHPSPKPPATAPSRETQARGWKTLILAGVFVAVLASAAVLRFPHVEPLTEKDTVVIADFANSTGDAVFDGTLRQGLAVQLEQSPFLRLVSEDRVQQTLRLMGQSPDVHLTPKIAREVCQRTGSAAVLDGSITQIGTPYLLTVKVVNCINGESLASTEAQASDKDHVLDSLGKAAAEIRGKLGESLSSVQKFDTPLEQATTPSLEALKAFSSGSRSLDGGDFKSSVLSFQRAIALDPNFALAYSALSGSYGNLGESSLAVANSKKAYELRERVSEREKLAIEINYNWIAIGDLEKTRDVLEVGVRTYPRDADAHFNLGNVYDSLGQYEKGLEQARESVRLEPASELSRDYLVYSYLVLNRFNEAQNTAKEALAKKIPLLNSVLYMLAFWENDAAGMAQQVASAIGKSGIEDVLLGFEANTFAYAGRLAKARELSRRAVTAAEQANGKETAASHEASSALREALFGNGFEARRSAAGALKRARGRDVQYAAALASAKAGDSAKAQSLAEDLAMRYPEDTLVRLNYLPALRAQLALNHQDASKAVDALEIALPYELMTSTNPVLSLDLYPVFVRGEAYLAAHQGAEAAAEFQKIIDHRGIVMNSPIGALAHLEIGRAYALEGDTTKARAAYQDFLTLWKDADADIPILKQAKAEYAKLQ